ncbi:MAG: hypothetical protein JWR44_3195 [Hymenobacter sp.]|jgi:hypothetical protein|nr:hypothetical protein [Hymenobacter sp.]
MTPEQIVQHPDGFVLFAGAGCSMAAPSRLPSWAELNDLIIEALWNKLEKYDVRARFREAFVDAIKAKRGNNTFPPDYQAQIMAERAGLKYFELLSAVDGDLYNEVHYYAALLAKAGLLKAVVTTNFDRNFERAFAQLNIPFTSYFDEAGFVLIASRTDTQAEIALIKIHGCCSAPASMVDTRKQRLKGRAKALMTTLRQLLERHHFVFAGFSGADFDSDPNYLGYRTAVVVAQGFTFLYLPGRRVGNSMQGLIAVYQGKAEAVACDPTQYLQDLLTRSNTAFRPFDQQEFVGEPMRNKLRATADALEEMDAVNMVVSLAESYGDEIAARYLYDRIWKNRSPDDYQGRALSLFLQNHGRSYVFNFQDKIARAKEVGVTIEISTDVPEEFKHYFLNPARKNLFNAKNDSPAKAALIALMQTYCGEPDLFMAFPATAQNDWLAASLTERADISYYYSIYAGIYGEYDPGLAFLNNAIAAMELDCDEPRLALLLSRRALIKCRMQDPSAAADAATAQALAASYHDPSLDAEVALARAVCARKVQQYSEAFELACAAREGFYRLRRFPQFIEASLEVLKSALQLLADEKLGTQALLDSVLTVAQDAEAAIREYGVVVYEPECCYLVGLLRAQYASVESSVSWFADALNLSQNYKQEANLDYYRETCARLGVLPAIDLLMAEKAESAAASIAPGED